MHPIADIVIGSMQAIDVAVQWGFGWRYVFSSSFRKAIHARWRAKGRTSAIGEALYAGLAFLLINCLLAAVLYRVMVGPIPPIHEWRS